MKKKILLVLSSIVIWVLVFIAYVSNAYAVTLENNPNVTWSPDGQAFTTDAGETGYSSYAYGTEVYTGVEAQSSSRDLKEGEHYYYVNKKGTVYIEKWVASKVPGECIHQNDMSYYHGLNFNTQTCLSRYKTGWLGVCAECHKGISLLFYMDKDTAKSMSEISTLYDYYYACPLCNHLEQGSHISHECKEISWNMYQIKYNKNSLSAIGYMEESTFMYNNETSYDGEEITPETRLKKCNYIREGYNFIGWNTERDGSGISFSDQEEIFNLTQENDVKITLYAQWEICESTLHIDANGGSFKGVSSITSVTQGYNTTFSVSADLVTPPASYTVKFVTNGGSSVKDIPVEQYFLYWKKSNPFYGNLDGDTYTFCKLDGVEDVLTAHYGCSPIILPESEKDGEEFGGWYKDPECTIPVGNTGDEVIITGNITLYAKWVSLTLSSTEDYGVLDGNGAVDLSWSQVDSYVKAYKLYQSMDNSTWKEISLFDSDGNISVDEVFGATGKEESYTVPYSGIYTITATGAKGEDYDTHVGGNGGRISAVVWLSKGEVLTYNIGTTEGYNGGGIGDPYGNGGGMTSVSSNHKGLFLIAGGGGGASAYYDGESGGSSQCVLDDTSQGGNGGAGGGGGYQGGVGAITGHTHDDTCEYHTHTGTSSKGGGCYTVPVKQRLCGYWVLDGPTWNGYARKYCSSGCGDHVDASMNGRAHYVTSEWGLGCGKIEGYQCGYDDATIEPTPAYGGSNYVNDSYCTLKSDEAGTGKGDGQLQISMASAQYIDNLYMQDVPAPDLALPDAVKASSVTKLLVTKTELKVLWDIPADYGTTYYHRAESYNALTGSKLCDSNITINNLLSGIKGYRYVIDKNPNTIVSSNDSLTTSNTLTVTTKEDIQYLHIATEDMAENLSATIHIMIDAEAEGILPEKTCGIFTEQISISGDSGNLYSTGTNKTWYVKADGVTPFTLSFNAYMDGSAWDSFQINHMIFDSTIENNGTNQRYQIFTPSTTVTDSDVIYKAADVESSISGTGILTGAAYTVATRTNTCRNMSLVQKFYLSSDWDGATLSVVPVAGANYGNSVIYSSWVNDTQHGVKLIADGTAPAVYGTELLENLEFIDREAGTVLLDLSCSDTGSGVKDFYATVTNLDSYIEKTYPSGIDGHIIMDLTDKDDYAFDGDFIITIHAIDNVGNDAAISYSTTGFSLSASVTRMREPLAPLFKKGEYGLLHVTTMGYVEKVVIEPLDPLFPEEIVLTYEYPSIINTEKIRFKIPLEAEDGTYRITVRAYKNGKILEAYPKIATLEVNGCILDDLRRRIEY